MPFNGPVLGGGFRRSDLWSELALINDVQI